MNTELFMLDSLINSNNNYTVFSKSGMCNIEGDYRGRPFGGLSIICKRHQNLTFHQIETNCDRLQAVRVCDKEGTCIHNIFNVYMPYYDGTQSRTEEFVTVVDHLQSLLSSVCNVAPVKLLGDFNVQLPRGSNIPN